VSRKTLHRNPHDDPAQVFIALQSFSTNDPETGSPVFAAPEQKFRGGKGTLPSRFPAWFVAADSDSQEIRDAKDAAGIRAY
jgi:hypothetical protein